MTMRGFTLVEVMVALAVVAFALVTLIASTGQYTRQSADLRDRTWATWIASDRLTQLRLREGFPDPGVESGQLSAAGQNWIWRAVITATPGENDLRRMDVAVALAATPDQPAVILTGFVGRHRGPVAVSTIDP